MNNIMSGEWRLIEYWDCHQMYEVAYWVDGDANIDSALYTDCKIEAEEYLAEMKGESK